MAGGFEPVDPGRCAHYAAFASQLGRQAFDIIYWLLFVLVIAMLFLSSWQYSGDLEKVQNLDSGSRAYRHRMKRCMYICALYSSISVVAVVMEVYALMALQFCDGEDLMSLYWSTWTMMQVGSLIAIFGILLAVSNSLRGRKNPPWALALGTPVLVVAGIGHAFHGAMRKRVQRVRSRSVSRQRGMSVSSSINRLEASTPISRDPTIRVDDSDREDSGEYNAKFVGFSPDGSPILRFLEDPGSALRPDRATVLGKNDDGHVIVVFRRGMALISEGKNYLVQTERLLPPPSPRPAVVRIIPPTEDIDSPV